MIFLSFWDIFQYFIQMWKLQNTERFTSINFSPNRRNITHFGHKIALFFPVNFISHLSDMKEYRLEKEI